MHWTKPESIFSIFFGLLITHIYLIFPHAKKDHNFKNNLFLLLLIYMFKNSEQLLLRKFINIYKIYK